MTATASRTKTLRSILFREDYVTRKPTHVDPVKGMVYGVKLVGLTSNNSHDIPGAETTEYTPDALIKAIPMYEGAPVNVGHWSDPGDKGTTYDRCGKVVNVRFEEDGLYGDLELLLTHPMGPRICEAALRMPDIFAMSHNANGKYEVRARVAVVREIQRVHSVDVVAKGGTVSSLFESERNMSKKITLRDVIKKATPEIRAKFKRLIESGGDMAATAVEDTQGEPSMSDHLGNLVNSVMNDASLSKKEKRAKISKALNLLDDDEALDEADDTDDGDDAENLKGDKPAGNRPKGDDKETVGDGTKKVTEDDEDTDEDESDVKEASRKIRELQHNLALRDLRDWILEECERQDVPADKELRESLTLMRDKKAIAKHLSYLKKARSRSLGQGRPRSQGQGGGFKESYSSRGGEPANAKEFADLIAM